MTLIITAIAALVTTVILLAAPAAARRSRLAILALMYWGAALMWCVDGFASLAEGESFVELSDAAIMADDALLGVCVVALGLLIWAAARVVGARGRSRAAAA